MWISPQDREQRGREGAPAFLSWMHNEKNGKYDLHAIEDHGILLFVKSLLTSEWNLTIKPSFMRV